MSIPNDHLVDVAIRQEHRAQHRFRTLLGADRKSVV